MIFVGIDKGAEAVKAVALKREAGRVSVVGRHYFPLDLDGTAQKQQEEVLAALSTLADIYRGRDIRYLTCLAQNQVSTHLIHFPFRQRYQILKSLVFELEDRLLFPVEDMISDIFITERGFSPPAKGDEGGGGRDVLVFSAFKRDIEERLALFQKAGLRPVVLTCGASALSNLIEDRGGEGGMWKPARASKPVRDPAPAKRGKGPLTLPVVLYLKIGHTHSTVFILEGGRLQNLCNFEWGLFHCVNRLAVKYETSFKKSLDHLLDQGFVLTQKTGYTGSQIAFSKMISESFENLIHRVRLLLLGLKGDKNYRCKKIFLFGEGVRIRNLQNLFSKNLGIPVSRLKNPEGFKDWTFGVSEKGGEGESCADLSTALGTALEGLRRFHHPAVNFLKGPFAPRFNPAMMLYRRFSHPVWMGACVGFVLLVMYAYVRQAQTERLLSRADGIFKKQVSEMTGLPAGRVSEGQARRFIDSKRKVLKNREMLEVLSQNQSSLDQLKSISMAIRKSRDWDLEIQKLKITGQGVRIEGRILKPYQEVLKTHLSEIAAQGKVQDSSSEEGDQSLKPASGASAAAAGKGGVTSPEPVGVSPRQPRVRFVYSFTQKK